MILIYLNGIDINQIQTGINKELVNISEWLKTNRLSLNVKKTITRCSLERNTLILIYMSLSIGGESMCEVQNTKFSGAMIIKTFLETA